MDGDDVSWMLELDDTIITEAPDNGPPDLVPVATTSDDSLAAGITETSEIPEPPASLPEPDLTLSQADAWENDPWLMDISLVESEIEASLLHENLQQSDSFSSNQMEFPARLTESPELGQRQSPTPAACRSFSSASTGHGHVNNSSVMGTVSRVDHGKSNVIILIVVDDTRSGSSVLVTVFSDHQFKFPVPAGELIGKRLRIDNLEPNPYGDVTEGRYKSCLATTFTLLGKSGSVQSTLADVVLAGTARKFAQFNVTCEVPAVVDRTYSYTYFGCLKCRTKLPLNENSGRDQSLCTKCKKDVYGHAYFSIKGILLNEGTRVEAFLSDSVATVLGFTAERFSRLPLPQQEMELAKHFAKGKIYELSVSVNAAGNYSVERICTLKKRGISSPEIEMAQTSKALKPTPAASRRMPSRHEASRQMEDEMDVDDVSDCVEIPRGNDRDSDCVAISHESGGDSEDDSARGVDWDFDDLSVSGTCSDHDEDDKVHMVWSNHNRRAVMDDSDGEDKEADERLARAKSFMPGHFTLAKHQNLYWPAKITNSQLALQDHYETKFLNSNVTEELIQTDLLRPGAWLTVGRDILVPRRNKGLERKMNFSELQNREYQSGKIISLVQTGSKTRYRVELDLTSGGHKEKTVSFGRIGISDDTRLKEINRKADAMIGAQPGLEDSDPEDDGWSDSDGDHGADAVDSDNFINDSPDEDEDGSDEEESATRRRGRRTDVLEDSDSEVEDNNENAAAVKKDGVFRTGDCVFARWGDDGCYYAGNVKSTDKNKENCIIEWLDGGPLLERPNRHIVHAEHIVKNNVEVDVLETELEEHRDGIIRKVRGGGDATIIEIHVKGDRTAVKKGVTLREIAFRSPVFYKWKKAAC